MTLSKSRKEAISVTIGFYSSYITAYHMDPNTKCSNKFSLSLGSYSRHIKLQIIWILHITILKFVLKFRDSIYSFTLVIFITYTHLYVFWSNT